ncbi:MAG: pyridoxal-phosphate dependent enzyme [Bacteroidales bacterium]|nr:pyridoxal-phosphate dependent enzyme [Bacteroidales bacterium]
MRIDTVHLGAFSIKGDVYLARDDMFPLFMGGNKARKMVHIISDIKQKHCDAVVTTGGIQSNHCRVVALACTLNNWKCKLVLHGSKEQFFSEKGNALLMRMTDAQLEFVEGNEIGPAMERSMEEFKLQGLNPYYLYGGGHNKAGVTAYVEAVDELKNALPSGTEIDHIFLASGTGSTQAGILAGCREVDWHGTKVHGVSIGREKKRGTEAILEALAFLDTDPGRYHADIDFMDDFLFGGYGKASQELQDFVARVAGETGVILDTTYSGKAFFGMLQTMKRKRLTGQVLFWHTGGIFNQMA